MKKKKKLTLKLGPKTIFSIVFLKDKIQSFHQNILNKNMGIKSLARNPYSVSVIV